METHEIFQEVDLKFMIWNKFHIIKFIYEIIISIRLNVYVSFWFQIYIVSIKNFTSNLTLSETV